jgi:hypothetical protein
LEGQLAFRTYGGIGLLSGAGFAVLTAYSISNGMLANSGLVSQTVGGGIAFVFVGWDRQSQRHWQRRSSLARAVVTPEGGRPSWGKLLQMLTSESGTKRRVPISAIRSRIGW